MIGLKEPRLLRSDMLIGGAWVQADSGERAAVRNPADGALIGYVPFAGATETDRAIAAAQDAMCGWRATTAGQRSRVLRRIYELMLEHADDLAKIITAEQGKPLAEAQGEVRYAAGFMEWFAEEAKRVYGDLIPENVPGRNILVQKSPVGVFAAITPWNFPAAMITRKAAPGWAAGCTGVIKPALETPLTALALGVLAEWAGLPPGVCNIVTGEAAAIGGRMTDSPVVRKLSFTGSTPIGALLLRQCAATIKRTSMELGGNAPLIVFNDADLDQAVTQAAIAKYRNSGQSCIAANRILVQADIYEEFTARFVEVTRELKVGPGLDPDTDIGPLISRNAVNKLNMLITDACARGAKILVGGGEHNLGNNFFEPTVLRDVPMDARICHEEAFGPVAPISVFDTDEDAVRFANDTPFGLAAYVFSTDNRRIFRTVAALEAGMVGVNEGLISTEVAPFGGVKQSGIGREGSRYGIEEYLEAKYIALGGLAYHEHH